MLPIVIPAHSCTFATVFLASLQDALLRIHAGGAVDIFGVPIVPDWQKSGGH